MICESRSLKDFEILDTLELNEDASRVVSELRLFFYEEASSDVVFCLRNSPKM